MPEIIFSSQRKKVDDSLKIKTFTYLKESFENNKFSNPDLAVLYAEVYLEKAKSKNDNIEIAKGYELFYKLNRTNSNALVYSDSIISLTKELKDYVYPARGYFLKAAYYYRQSNYDLALENYLLMEKFAKLNGNPFQQNKVKHSMGLLKNASGEEKQAVPLFEEYYNFIKDHKDTHQTEYLVSLIALTDAYVRKEDFGSAKETAFLGIKESYQDLDKRLYSSFLLSHGIADYYLKKTKTSIDTLKKAEKLLSKDLNNNDVGDLLVTYLYLAKAYDFKNDKAESVKYLVSVDSLAQSKDVVYQEIRDAYGLLIDYYRKVDDKDKQLKYIERLLSVDSILYKNERYLSKNILKSYETPKLLSEKEKIIQDLDEEKGTFRLLSIFISVLLLITISIILYLNKKRKIYKERFSDLMSKESKSEIKQKEIKINSDQIGIQDSVINEILTEINNFEKNHGFLEKEITLVKIAKQLNTNSTYLSKIVNTYKGKSFNSYINDLRIDYAIEKIKNDKKFRSYSIKAIAIDLGFRNSESFSKAFYKNTGVYPSYFVKQVQKSN
ncbi:helix-turn-helix domain-containing protein [Aquimarina sp. BL5]|uniref:helix-turn-helix domain-containing protein n=1 Tax=Aquimarina sp. BL5 TaxID=1714860 RepID=UPI0013143E0E|nr:helix-turn-helix domain-containing protein [Aquimarina sp. BL5]